MLTWLFLLKNGATMKRKTTLKITQTALMTALIAVMAQIVIPFFTVPMTLQTFAVCLAGFLLGKYRSMASVAAYLALGAVGMPIFAGWQGSLGVLAGPTGGFLIGFLPLAFFCGISARNKVLSALFPIIGLILCHLMGICHFAFQSGNKLLPAFLLSSAPYLLKDFLSCFLANLLAKKTSRIIGFNKN